MNLLSFQPHNDLRGVRNLMHLSSAHIVRIISRRGLFSCPSALRYLDIVEFTSAPSSTYDLPWRVYVSKWFRTLSLHCPHGLAMWPFSSPIRGKLDGHGVLRHLSSLVSKPVMHDSIVFRKWAEMIGFRCVPYIISLRPLSYLTRGELVLKEPRHR